MLTEKILNRFAARLAEQLSHTGNGYNLRIILSIIGTLEAEMNKLSQYSPFISQAMQSKILEIEKKFIQLDPKTVQFDQAVLGNVNAAEDLEDRDNIDDHIVLCHARITLFKLIIAQANQAQYLFYILNDFYITTLHMFNELRKNENTFPSEVEIDNLAKDFFNLNITIGVDTNDEQALSKLGDIEVAYSHYSKLITKRERVILARLENDFIENLGSVIYTYSENLLESNTLLTLAKIPLMKLLIAKGMNQSGNFIHISNVVVYGVIFHILDNLYRDTTYDLHTHANFINLSTKEYLPLSYYANIELLILQDCGLLRILPEKNMLNNARVSVLNSRNLFTARFDSSSTKQPLLSMPHNDNAQQQTSNQPVVKHQAQSSASNSYHSTQ